jgi:hypothetical protein
MREIAFCAALLLLAVGPARAAPPILLSTEEVVLLDEWGSRLADARAEARLHSEGCRKPDSSCVPKPLAPRELVPASEPCSGVSRVMGWRYAEELGGATREAAELRQHAATRELFDCSGTACLVVVHTTTPLEKEKDVQTLSICSVQVVRGVPGAPSRCQEALKLQPGSSLLLRGEIGSAHVSCSMGMRDFDAVFGGRAADMGAVRQLVGDVLRAKPFNLNVMEEGEALVGTRQQLPSDVLDGWREWVTVRVDINARGTDVGTSIITWMLVSKQATGRRDAWTPPTEPQEAAYVQALRSAFERRGGVLGTGTRR